MERKAFVPLNLDREFKGNKKSFYREISDRMKTREIQALSRGKQKTWLEGV